ncbi:major facilitator superfamily domain-containing protein [Phyllosticta citribraziliensis]
MDTVEDVPGTEYLVDVSHNLDVSHAGAGTSDIVLLPQPTLCGGDPLNWSKYKKYYQLFLLSLYACSFSYGENILGAAWTTVSQDTGVSLTNMNGGSALNYLLLGFVNIFWIPACMKIGRRPVLLLTTILTLSSALWTGFFHGTVQWMLSMVLGGFGTSAYEAVIQLCVFDMFFVHQRGRALSVYLFGQQLGSILGLVAGGSVADALGWRWSQYISAIINGGVLLLLLFTFEETMFPRFLFTSHGANIATSTTTAPALPAETNNDEAGHLDMEGKKPRNSDVSVSDVDVGAIVPDIPARTWPQRLKLWTYYEQDRTSYWHYFKLPFYLFTFPNIVIPGFIFAFACTAGIVSFNTVSEILTAPPYNWSTTSTGLLCLAALVGAIMGYTTSGPLSDALVLRLARRNGGVKEPEMRLWALAPCSVYGGAGYLLYGWGAARGLHWAVVAVGLGGMIAQQVGASGVATAYAMDCFADVGGELVVVLAICSSCVNFAVSYAVQPFIEAAGYGVAFTVFGALVMGSLVGGVALGFWGKRWRRMCKVRYMGFLTERGALMVQV